MMPVPAPRPAAPAVVASAPVPPPTLPRPPACLPHALLDAAPQGARVAVAGLVLVRQRPGTAKGVIFVTLEDETGVCNVVVWKAVKHPRIRRAK